MAIRNLKTYTPTKEELIEMDGEEPLTLIESANFESLGITEEEAEENEIKTLKENAQIFLRNLKRSVEKCSPKTPLDILKATLTLDDGSSVKFSQGHHGKIAFGEGDRVHYNAHLIKLA
ncbi:MAG: hypothetical protein O8C67_05165, partial [Candidatus Methanoperedens sp.]|nr:hypothetical protein [Candidatus Methanoperedens sp.]